VGSQQGQGPGKGAENSRRCVEGKGKPGVCHSLRSATNGKINDKISNGRRGIIRDVSRKGK